MNGDRFHLRVVVSDRAVDAENCSIQVWVPYDAPGLRIVDECLSSGQRTTASGSI